MPAWHFCCLETLSKPDQQTTTTTTAAKNTSKQISKQELVALHIDNHFTRSSLEDIRGAALSNQSGGRGLKSLEVLAFLRLPIFFHFKLNQ